MCDGETTGKKPGKHGLIQIAAVKWNYDTGEVSTDFFDRCLRLHPGREWDLETRQWWTRQGNVLTQIEQRAEDPYTVMRDFQAWLLKDWPTAEWREEGLQFWAKPTHFDWGWIVDYFELFGLDMPCHYRYARDLNSFMAGLQGHPRHPKIPIEPDFQGESHNALFDTIHQIRLLQAMKQQSTQGVILPPEPVGVPA